MRGILATLLVLSVCGGYFTMQGAVNSDLENRRKGLTDLLAEQWEYRLRTNPQFATIVGDKRYNDRLDDFSQKEIDENLEQNKRFLARFQAIDTSGFPEQESLNKALMIRQLQRELDESPFKPWEMPVNQFSGIHIQLPQFVTLLPFTNVKDYEDYISRLKQVPRAFDENIAQMQNGMRDGLMPPRFLLEKVVKQAQAIANMPPEKTPFAHPVESFPSSISGGDQKRLRDGVLEQIRVSVLPSYTKFIKFVSEDYAPKGRTEPGAWSLPDGEARYALAVKRVTTTSMTAEEIHQLGLKQVAEIESQMRAIAQKLGYSDIKSLNDAINNDPKLHEQLYAHSREEILDLYRKHIDEMWQKLPQLFGHVPKEKLEVMPIEQFREKEAATHYNPGTPDGSRPAHVMVNTGDYEHRKLISVESTAYHEGVPGHHMQISIAQEMPTLPPFRQHAFFTAYIEGWALYSERLGKEVGFYQDPYSDYGRLQDEMLRAIRLVVDTGVHYKKWSRQQMVDFFHAHSAVDEPDVQSETDRYIAWPGQALGYKVGQLKIIELRERAKKELGDRFDLRSFHDEVLDAGALPLDVLDERITEWIGGQQKSAKMSQKN
ncbi:MAG: DUF885 domain-containing protein [Acidobacteriaceae bacterium]|nr:DUF885 domain-containing protein [Acidobacteriaceae bacterium]